jgi:hypothetical protein
MLYCFSLASHFKGSWTIFFTHIYVNELFHHKTIAINITKTTNITITNPKYSDH